jgi:hypothetical protein
MKEWGIFLLALAVVVLVERSIYHVGSVLGTRLDELHEKVDALQEKIEEIKSKLVES